MRVALVIERIETWRGGAETSTMQFARHLAELGGEVTMVTASSAPSTPSLEIVPIHAGRWGRARKTRLFARRAVAYVQRHAFDVVHSITPCTVADVYQPRGGTIPEMLERNQALRDNPVRRRFKGVVQRANPKYRVLAELEKRTLNRQPPPYVIAISQYVARQLEKHYRFNSSHVVQIFNGVDPDPSSDIERLADRQKIRRQFNIGREDYVVLCVAHNFKLKGVPRLIEAMGRLKQQVGAGKEPQRRVAVIVGRDNPASLAPLVEKQGLSNDVIFTGPTQRIRSFFHAADVLAHPTYYDPCSRVVIEALASGVPAITTRFNGAAELIEQGREGYVLDTPDDVDGLAECIACLADAEHRTACAERAARAVEGITMKHHAEQVMALYERIVAARAGG